MAGTTTITSNENKCSKLLAYPVSNNVMTTIANSSCVNQESSRVVVYPVLHLWLKLHRNIKLAYDCPGSGFVNVVGVCVELPSELSIHNSFIKRSMQCKLNTKTILSGVFSVETITYLSQRRDRCLATFGSLQSVHRPTEFVSSNLYIIH